MENGDGEVGDCLPSKESGEHYLKENKTCYRLPICLTLGGKRKSVFLIRLQSEVGKKNQQESRIAGAGPV